MTTVSEYPPSIIYIPSFDEGIHSNSPDQYSKTSSIRKFSGSSVEELLYTKYVFLDMVNECEILEEDLFFYWKRYLGEGPRKIWNSITQDDWFEEDTRAGFDDAMAVFVAHYASESQLNDNAAALIVDIADRAARIVKLTPQEKQYLLIKSSNIKL